jgi:hypothetical protein
VTLIWKFIVADVIVPESSFVTVRAMTAVPVLPASALVMAGTSLADERGTVKVVVLAADGSVGDELPHPTVRMVTPTTRSESRFMLFCLLSSLRRISERD